MQFSEHVVLLSRFFVVTGQRIFLNTVRCSISTRNVQPLIVQLFLIVVID